MAIKKIVAGEEFSPTNSTGGELASSVNSLIDVVEHPETGNAELASRLGETQNEVGNLKMTISRDGTAAKKLFSRSALGEIDLNYIVSGDSNRSNNFNNMINYYNTLLGQIGVAVVDNSRSGQSGLNWKNGASSPTVQEAIDATPGTGATTLLEYSFGPNDSGTNSEIKAALKGGVELYLAAKPDATVVLCSPVRTSGKYGSLISIYEEIAQELGLQLIKPHTIIEPYDNDPRFKQDNVHLNNYGSQRLLHFILSNMVDEVTRSSITIPDLGVITPPDANINVVTKVGYWNYSDGVYKPTPDTWRCTEIIPVEPNYTLHVDHGGTTDKVYWYDIDGVFISAGSMPSVGANVYNVVVPSGAYGMALNITDDGATYDALSYVIDVHYVIEEQNYMSPEDTNVNMALGFPRQNKMLLDSNGKTGSKGQVLVSLGLGKTQWTTIEGLGETTQFMWV